MSTYNTIADIKQANRDAGQHFFDADTLRFFRSRVAPSVIGGRFFVTSEQHVPYDGKPDARRYTVRVVDYRGHVDTVGEFQAYDTLAQARKAARRAADNYERAARDASLGVGHIWTNVRCPAYRDYEPTVCICQQS